MEMEKKELKQRMDTEFNQNNYELQKLEKLRSQAGQIRREQNKMREEMKIGKKQMEEAQKNKFRHQMIELENRDALINEQLRLQRIKNQRNLKGELDFQGLVKEKNKQLQKQRDHQFARLQEIEADRYEKGRQQYFAKMQGYQKANSQREKLYDKFRQETYQDKAMRDEAVYVNKIRHSSRLDAEQALREKEDKLGNFQVNANALDGQINERVMQKSMDRQADQEYARIVQERLQEERNYESVQQQIAKERLSQYRKSLQNQMAEQHKRKKYEGLMTEHERKVNNPEIQAYQDRRASPLHPSSRSYRTPPQPYRNAISPNISMMRDQDSFYEIKQSIQDGGKILPPLSPKNKPRKFHHIEHYAVLPRGSPNVERSNEIAQETRENMNAPGVESFRHITANKSYGVHNDQQVRESVNFLNKKPHFSNLISSRNGLNNSVSLQEIKPVSVNQAVSYRDRTPPPMIGNSNSFAAFERPQRQPIYPEAQHEKQLGNYKRNNILLNERVDNSNGVMGLLPGASKHMMRKSRGNYGRKELSFFQHQVHKDFNILRGF